MLLLDVGATAPRATGSAPRLVARAHHTAELHRQNPFDYPTALQVHATAVAQNPADWMPWNYRATVTGLSCQVSIPGPEWMAKRTAFTGPKRQLEEVEPALARGSGWSGGGRGPAPRAGVASEKLGIRVAKHERERWQHDAEEAGRSLSDWIRNTRNAAAPERSKAKP